MKLSQDPHWQGEQPTEAVYYAMFHFPELVLPPEDIAAMNAEKTTDTQR